MPPAMVMVAAGVWVPAPAVVVMVCVVVMAAVVVMATAVVVTVVVVAAAAAVVVLLVLTTAGYPYHQNPHAFSSVLPACSKKHARMHVIC